jgi:GNAT superfamily N-acetyltransferase
LSRFVLEGDKAAREMGIKLRLRHDFGDLLYLNRKQVARGNWHKLVYMFDPEYSDLQPANSYWISGEDEHGDIVVTQAGRVYYWPESTLEREAAGMFYAGREQDKECVVTAPDARTIGGVVFYGGSVWVRPDLRGNGFSKLLPRLGRAYALARWPLDWGISFVDRDLVEKGVATGYGYKHVSFSVAFPGSPWGALDLAVVSVSPEEAYADFTKVLLAKFSSSKSSHSSGEAAVSTREHRLTKVSSDGVFHGSNSLS